MITRSEIEDDRRVYSPVHQKPAKKYRNYTTASTTETYTYTTNTDSTVATDKADGACLSWMKYGVLFANVVFLIVGMILLVMGIWLRTDSRFRDFISERYRQAVENAFWDAPTLFSFSYIIIVLGAVMIVVAMIGCCGVTGRSRLFLIVYSMAVFVVLVFTLASGIYLIYKKYGLETELSDALDYMVQHYYQGPGIVQESLDKLQTTFMCCGNAGCSDFRMFRQDIPRTCDIRCDGCHYRIMVALRIAFSVTLVIFFAVVICEVLTIFFALYFVFTRKKEVRVIYVQEEPRRRAHLTREALSNHDMPYNLRKQKRSVRYY